MFWERAEMRPGDCDNGAANTGPNARAETQNSIGFVEGKIGCAFEVLLTVEGESQRRNTEHLWRRVAEDPRAI